MSSSRLSSSATQVSEKRAFSSDWHGRHSKRSTVSQSELSLVISVWSCGSKPTWSYKSGTRQARNLSAQSLETSIRAVMASSSSLISLKGPVSRTFRISGLGRSVTIQHHRLWSTWLETSLTWRKAERCHMKRHLPSLEINSSHTILRRQLRLDRTCMRFSRLWRSTSTSLMKTTWIDS